MSLTGYANNEVYFWSSKEKKTQRVPWKDRYNFNQDGYIMMGKGLALERGEDGKPLDTKIFTDYDSAEEIHNKLKDGEFVYVSGDLNYRPYKTKENEKRTAISLVPSRVYLQKAGYGWEDIPEDKAGCIFKQRFIYMDIEQEVNDENKPTGRFIVHGKVVCYNSIESVSFILESRTVANNVKKKVKPYTAMDVYGLIKLQASEEKVVVEDDGWGDQSFATKVTAPTRREFCIIRIDKDSFDTDTYKMDDIKKAIDAVAANEKVEETYEANSETKKDEDAWGSSMTDDEDDWGEDSDPDDDLPF